MKILARNFRCPRGEVDLIALDATTRKALGAETIVFVEVKTRSSDRYASPAAAVDARKRQQIRRAADYYLQQHDTEGYRVRFDVVSVVVPEGERPRVEHVRDAF
jgi:putative endonuclease